MDEDILAGSTDSILSSLLKEGRLAIATERLVQRARMSGADKLGVLTDLIADCACLAQAMSNFEPVHVGASGPANLYLLSDLRPTSDEIQYLKRIVETRPNERHVVILTNVVDSDADQARQGVRALGAFPLLPPLGLTAFDRLIWLRGKVTGLIAQRVFLLHRPADLFALISGFWLAPLYAGRLYLLDPELEDVPGWARMVQGRTGATILPVRPFLVDGMILHNEVGLTDVDVRQAVAGSFDRSFYLWANPSVAEDGSDPLLQHYLDVGRKTGRKPHPLFEEDHYLWQLPPEMVEAAAVFPFGHYLTVGERLGFRPHPFFEPVWCREMLRRQGAWPENGCASNGAPMSVLGQYDTTPGFVSPHPLFDPQHYARQLPLQMQGAGLLIHFLEQGVEKGLSPHPLIDVSRLAGNGGERRDSLLVYLCKRNPSACEGSPHVLFDPAHFAAGDADRFARVAPNLLWAHLIEGNRVHSSPHPLISLEHVARSMPSIITDPGTVIEGLATGRIKVDTHPLVSGVHIRAQVPWFGTRGVHPTAFYLSEGAAMRIDPHPMFSAGYYLDNNPSVAASGENPLLNYLTAGESADQAPHPFFSVSHYRTRVGSDIKPGHYLEHYVTKGARHFVPVQPLDATWHGLLNKAALRSFRGAPDVNGSTKYLKESLHSEWAPPHPTLVTEVRPLDRLGQPGDELHPAVTIPVRRPAIAAQVHLTAPSGSYAAPAAVAAIYRNALVVGGNDGFITEDGIWFDPGLVGFDPDTMTPKDGGAVVAVHGDAVLLRRFDGKASLRRAIFGCGTSANNYFHFIIEALPRAIMAAGVAPPGTAVLVNDGMPAQHYQALRLALPNNPLIRVPSHGTIKVHELHAATMPSLVHDAFGGATPPTDAVRYHPEVLKRLTRLADPFREGAPRRRLFLRRVSTLRNLLNIDAVEAALVDLGFESVSSERLDFAEQVHLFANAEVIVGPTGAHFTNMVFLPQGARVMPLYSNAPGNNFYLWSVLGDLLGQQVTCVAGWRAAGSAAARRVPEAHEDFTVPPVLVTAFFNKDRDITCAPPKTCAPVEAFDALLTSVSEARTISSSWGIVAGPTPEGFEGRLVKKRCLARDALLACDQNELIGLLRHPFFANPEQNHISGLPLLAEFDQLDRLTLARLDDAAARFAATPAEDDAARLDRLRLLMLTTLYRQSWQMPILRDLADLPVVAVDMYMSWLNATPLLCRPGDDTAYGDFVTSYLDWLQVQLDPQRSLDLLLPVGRAIGGLDLGKLLLIDQPMRAVQERRNRLLARLAPREGEARSAIRPADGSQGRLRVGILCRTFDKGPDAESIVAFVRGFDHGRYELRAYSVGLRDRVSKTDDSFERLFNQTFDAAKILDGDAASIRRQLIEDQLDVFLHANASSFGLGELDKALFHRAAPLQVAMNSHLPIPPGYPSFDAFITGRSGRDEEDMSHDELTGRLIRCEGPVINYITSLEMRADRLLTRAEFGLGENEVVAMTAGSLAKLNHRCLATMMRGVRDIPNGRLLIAPYNPGWAGLSLAFPFNRQISETAAETGLDPARITVLGEMTVEETEAALSLSDIYLNPFPHGGATMTHLALIYGKPSVTLLRRSTRSIDQFLIGALGLQELLAKTPEDYVALVQKLGTDASFRLGLSKRIEVADRSALVNSASYAQRMYETVKGLIEG